MIECSAEPSVLAGQDGSPDYLFQTNLVGAYHCLEACRRHGAGIIFLSTSRIYPIARLEAHPWREEKTRFTWDDDGTPGISLRGVTESVALDGPRSLYGYTKLSAEQLIEEYRATYGLKAVVNRCGVIAGPWQFGKVDQGVAALWVMAHHYKRNLAYIGYGGAGKQVRDMLHIHDLCELLVEQVQNFQSWDGWIGNVAGGLDCSASLQELTAHCQEITGNTIDITSIPETRPNDLRIFVADCSKLEAKLAEIRGQGRKAESGNEKAEMGRRRNQGTGDRGQEAEISSSVSAFRFPLSDFRFPTRTIHDILTDTHEWVSSHEQALRLL